MEQKKNAAKFAFFYLLSLVGLIFVSISVGMIVFEFINKFVEDPANFYNGVFSGEAVRFGIAAIFVAGPIFYIINRIIQRSLYKGDLDKDAKVRHWLTYFILFVSSVVMIGWLIGIILNFLNGELTIRFILKAATSLIIASSIFSFYLYEARREAVLKKKDRVIQIFTWSSLAVVVGVFVLGLFIMESPKELRNKRLDQQIIDNFYSIDSCVNEYYEKNKKLPETIKQADEMCSYKIRQLSDPETKKLYEYKTKENNKYDLCAEFRTSNIYSNQNEYYYQQKRNDMHESGWQCLEREIYIADSLEDDILKPVVKPSM